MADQDRDEKGRYKKDHHPLREFRSEGEAKSNGKKGGVASGKARRERKRLREIAQIVATEEIEVTMPDKTKKKTTFDEALVIGQYKQAISGKTEAAKFIATILDEYVEKKEENLNTPKGIVIIATDDKQKELLEAIAKRK